MVSMNETSGGLPLANALAAGLTDISYSATVSFSAYVRTVLPLDGYIFWVRSDLVTDAAKTGLSADTYNGPATIEIPGSLHISTETFQKEDQNLDLSTIIFTTNRAVRPFHDVGQNMVWIGNFQGIRFGINTRNNYYRQAELHHYVGSTIVPTTETQIIDDISQLEEQELIVSNSLPFFLALDSQVGLYDWLNPPTISFHPSFLSPDNMIPPYATVEIIPGSVQALQAGAAFDNDGTRWQLTKERVRLTFFGLRNQQIMDVLDYITRWSLIFDKMGIMNMPIVEDEKQIQPEIGAIAMKKTITLEVNYYQKSARDISRQLIKHCLVGVVVD